MKRKAMRKQKDRKIYNHTANKTKKINLSPRIMRGGIRF